MKQQTAVGLALLVASLLLAVPTAALTLQSGEGVDNTASLDLSPASSHTGSYATIDSNGELVLDFDALNDEAVTSADAVFTVTSTAEGPREVWIEHELEGVTFYAEGDRANHPTEGSPIRLEPNETVTVGLAIDTHVATAGTGPFSVVTRSPAAITLEDVTVEPTSIQPGKNVTVTATYRNMGTDSESTVANLVEGGIVVDQQSFTIAAGATETVTFVRQLDQQGTYNITVDDHPATAVQVGSIAPPPPPPGGGGGPDDPQEVLPDVLIRNATLEADTIGVGESSQVNVTVENRGQVTGEIAVELAVDGIVTQRERIAVEPGDVEQLEFTLSFDEPGSYAIAVNGDSLETVIVQDTFDVSVFNREFGPPLAAAVAPPIALGLIYGISNRRQELE